MQTSSQIENGTEKAILEALQQAKGYVTVPYLAQISGSAPQAVEQYVAGHPEQVRKSRIETEDGQPLYMFNAPLSALADAWSAFRLLNAKKF